MTEPTADHRLNGLEPDNLLAFLTLLGLLRALEARDQGHAEFARLHPRAAWDVDHPPLRPILRVAQITTAAQVVAAAAEGLGELARQHNFSGEKDLAYEPEVARSLLMRAVEAASSADRYLVDLLAALMTDAAVKRAKKGLLVEPTPLCLLFGQGHQHFLQRLTEVPSLVAPSRSGSKGRVPSEEECLAETLFAEWHREDPTFSFRWDPEEDVRYALMAGDPTVAAYERGTQHGANRLAAVGLAALTVAPRLRAGRVHVSVLGGTHGVDGIWLAWPIWRGPATLSAVRALLAHPMLYVPGGLAHLGVDQVMVTHRISVGKYMNFTRARPLTATA